MASKLNEPVVTNYTCYHKNVKKKPGIHKIKHFEQKINLINCHPLRDGSGVTADGSLLTANAVGAGPTNTVIKQERTGPGGAVETGVDTVNYDANALAGATAGTFAQVLN